MSEKKDKRKGLFSSIVLHVVLLLLFAFFGLSYQIPPPEEEGITINFGFSQDGMNTVENNSPTELAEETPSEPIPVETEVEVNEEVLTQNSEEAVAIEEKKEEEKKVEEVIEKKEEPKPNSRVLDAIDKLKNKNTEQGGGDGITDKAGNQGALDGDKDSKNYSGGGAGNGVTFNLAGRNRLSSPPIKDNSQKEGKVVVDIIVDKYGKVLRASPGARGSTTTDASLYKKAKEAALKTKFNGSSDAAEEQKGTITFIFILN